ncbi:MAG: hypothetical protein PHG30_02380 [Eubacteriales bacterium]|nr:hypothetical protein [Eubacteriales bacterium]
MLTANRAADLTQRHFGNIAGRVAEKGNDRKCIKVPDSGKILTVKVVRSVDTAAGQQHICHRRFQRALQFHLHIEIVQLFQKAVLPDIHQVRQIIHEIVVHDVA